eukprot:864211-Pyramimonas_sp.AAC.1
MRRRSAAGRGVRLGPGLAQLHRDLGLLCFGPSSRLAGSPSCPTRSVFASPTDWGLGSRATWAS